MAVFGCTEEGCQRHISVSRAPGGNPVALADPEGWAFLFAVCPECGRCICDRCIARRKVPVSDLRCFRCGGHFQVPDREKNAAIVRSLSEGAWRRKELESVAEMLTALHLCGVQLTPAESKKLAYCSRHSSRS